MKSALCALATCLLGVAGIAPAHADVTPPTCAELPDGTSCTLGSGATGTCSAGSCVAATSNDSDDDGGCAGGGLLGGLALAGAGVVAAAGGLWLTRRRT
ncbi:MAG: hypothetical protein U1F43_29440 [Myxococcota bacterium]